MKFAVLPYWKSLSPRRRKVVAWAAGLLVFYTVFGFLILPMIVRSVASRQLTRELNREVTIQSVRINPYALSSSLRGLLIKDRDGEPFVSWDEVFVNFQLASFFGRPWVFKEVRTTNTFVRAQMNKDYTFNFSDLIEKFAQTNQTVQPATPPKPFALRIQSLSIRGARASVVDLTPRQPFRRMLGPLEITLNNFHTDPENKNPYSFAGSTDSGEVFSWSGHFFLNPIRSDGEWSVANVALNKFAALYQDLVRFEIRDGLASFRGAYRFVKSPETNVVSITNVVAALRSFKLAEPGADENLVEVPGCTVSGVTGDLLNRRLEVGSVSVTGALLNLRRARDASINLVEMAKPSETATNAPGGILFLLQAVTNVFSMLLESTNAAQATLHDLSVENCAVALSDEVYSRPARLSLDQINVSAKNLSNMPGTNLTVSVSLRWNTNGTVKTEIAAGLAPPSADLRVFLDQVELSPLNPYLEPHVNLFVLGSKLGLEGRVKLRGGPDQLPVVTFSGASRLDDFATVDGLMAEDLIKWRSLRIDGIEANLNPPTVSVAKIELHDAFARVAMATNQAINVITALRPANTNAPVPPAKLAGEVQTPKGGKRTLTQVKELLSRTNNVGMTDLAKLDVGLIVISNAHVQLADHSISPPVAASLQQIHGTIRDVSTDELRRAQIHIQGRADNTGPVEITGQINPLHRDSASEVKVVFKDVEMNPADPYTGKFLGYRLRKGKLSMEVSYQVTARHLKGQNRIQLDQFTLGEKVNSPDATKLPVKLGIALLKDRSGRIELDVPVEGNLDDPKFRLGRVIWGAVANVFTKIVTSPFAALGGLFGGKGEEVRYQEFEPGSSELLPAAKEKLDALAKALYERPGLELEIEGNADPAADRDGLRRRALERQLRLAKWSSLRKSEQAATSVEQVVVSADERGPLLSELHAKAVGEGATVDDSPKPNVRPAARPGAKGAEALAQLQLKPEERQQMLQGMEQRLLASISVGDQELQTLAGERAKEVQNYLVQTGQVEAARVYLSQTGQAAGTNGHRVNLHLR